MVTTLHQDTFNRSNGGIGIASDGHSYTVSGSGTWSIVSNTLKILNPDDNGRGNAAHGGASSGDIDARFDMLFNDGNTTQGMFLRGSATNSYFVGVQEGSDLIVSYTQSGTNHNIKRVTRSIALSTWYSLRVVMYGSLIKVKLWLQGASEPTNWTLETTDTRYSSGGCGFFLMYGSSNTRYAQFDNFLLQSADWSTLSSLTRTVPLTASFATLLPRVVPLTASFSGAVHKIVPLNASFLATNTRTVALSAALENQEFGVHVRALPSRTEYAISKENIGINERIDQRSTSEFRLVDMSDAYTIQEGQRFEITGDGERLFLGFIDSIESERVPYNTPKFHVVRGKDERALADNRYYDGGEFHREVAGSIAVEIHHALLFAEGVTALYARDVDHDAATWMEGTLTHTVVDENGALTLSVAGTPLDVIENTTTAFSTGTLTDVSASNNTLTLTPTTAIRLAGFANAAKGTDLSSYRKIWGGTQSVASGDRLAYDIWCPSTSPEAKAGVDLIFSDKSYLKKGNKKDQYGVLAAPSTDLASRAADKWYHREITLTSYAGKSIKSVLVGLEGDKSGHYKAYIKNIKLLTGAGALKATFFSGTFQANTKVSNKGFTQESCTAVTTYPESGTRTTTLYDLGSMQYATTSLVQWVVDIPEGTDFKIFAKVGGSPPMECTQNQTLPNLISGSYVIGKDVALVEKFSVDSPEPIVTPVLRATRLLVSPAYYQSKYDVEDLDIDATTLGTGTLSNLTADSTGLHITGFIRDWEDGDFTTGQTMYASGGSPVVDVDDGSLLLTCGNTYDIRLRQDAAGQWQNFVLEADIYIVANAGNHGIAFRSLDADWTNTKGRWAYWLYLDNVSMVLQRGAAGGTITTIQTIAGDFPADTWHRLKIICNGTSIQGYVDDELYVDATDGNHNHTGYFGTGFWNDTTGVATGRFDNIGVMGLTMGGTRVHPSLDLATVGVVHRSQITWDADVPDVCTLLVEASVDGGSNYYACENGGVIPGLEQDVDATALDLLVRVTMSSANANATPVMRSIWVRVNGHSTAGGTRVSPTINITNVLHLIGSTSVTWDADEPVDTSLLVEASIDDGGSWATCENGGAIPGIAAAPDLWSDGFDSDTSASYTYL